MALLADTPLLLGNDLLPWLMLAVGAALVVGNVAARLRPPPPDKANREAQTGEVTPEVPPLGRTLVMVALGLLVSIWAIASLVVK